MAKKKSKYALPEKKTVISEENAHAELMKLLIRNNVDIEKVDEDRQGAVEKCIDMVLDAIMYGHVEIIDEGGSIKVKQNIQHRSEGSTVDHLIYGEVSGASHIDMTHHEANPMATSLSLLAQVCESNTAASDIKALRSSDLSRAEAISTLFL